jgi:hypothetical protein
MPLCPACGADLVRIHRTRFEKLVYADKFRCRTCGRRTRRVYRGVARPYRFVFSKHTRCVNCGNEDVRRSSRRDRSESVSTNLLSRLLGLTRAPLNACGVCRTQYHDWRRPRSKTPAPAEADVPTQKVS